VPGTSLIGREHELVVLRRRILDDGTRLLTLTGPPGVGKTRLAIEVAANAAEAFADGVYLVDLAPLTDPDLVAQAIARATGVQDVPERPLLAALADALRDKRALIVLDNFEHLTDATPLVTELVQSCPTITLLVTSRETLRLSEEQILPVDPLGERDAVRLFVDRARGASPDFSLTPENAVAVGDVCRRLDGLPLAIELAAARANVLSARMMLALWERGFALSTSGARDLPPRQRTLRAAFDWSYDQLPAAEQALLRRLSVFAGGFTLDAVEATCVGLPAPETEPLEILTSLVDKHLVRAAPDAGDERRFSLLVSIRDYARERLGAAGEVDDACSLHAAHFVSFAREGEPNREGPDEAAWFDRLETENDNLRAALAWLLGLDEKTPALELCASLGRFWLSRHVEEGRRWLGAALAEDDPRTPPRVRSQGVGFAAALALRQGDLASARALAEQSLAEARRTDDRLAVARALQTLGSIAGADRDERASGWLRDSLELYTEVGNQAGRASILNALGEEARQRGELETAAAAYSESLALARSVGDVEAIGTALHNLGQVALGRADVEHARDLFSEAMQVTRDLGDQHLSLAILAGLAEVAAATGPATRAATLLGAAERQAEVAGVRFEQLDREPFERSIERVRGELDEVRFAERWNEGASLTLDRAFSLAERTQPGTGVRGTNELTEREIEIVRLVAEGLSNAEIATGLFVSEHTVHRHLANVRRKLGVSSRAAVVAYAAKHELI
jgi:predicted ATPase/DNA-binding CsgD family transcriptional regulator